jgi:dihydrofolate reductase
VELPPSPNIRRPQVEVFIATSLDGFIARPDGAIDWLMDAQAAAPAGEDFGYAAFMAGVDALVMGRKTFESVLGFDPWPYGSTPVHVMTRQAGLPVPPALQGLVHPSALAPAALLEQLAAQGVRRVYLDGGELIRTFLAEDRVDRMTVTTVPVLIGEGRPLFGPLGRDRRWTLEAVRHWPQCGFVQAVWQARPKP